MSRAMRTAVLCIVSSLLASGCPDHTGTPPSDEQLDAIAAAVRARYVELEVTDERQTPALYEFGSKLTKLTPVFDAAGRLVFEASGGWLFWCDLQPTSRHYHEGLLLSVADDGTVLDVGPTTLPPALVGDAPWRLTLAETRAADVRRAGPSGLDSVLSEIEASAVLAKETPAPEVPSEPGNSCTPKRVLIAVAGEAYGDTVTAAGQAKDLADVRAWSGLGGIGIADADAHVLQADAGGSISRDDLNAAIAGAELECCDEVLFYFTGHAHPERGLVLKEEALVTAGIDRGKVDSSGDYLDATGLFEVVGASRGCSWVVILDASHSGPFGEQLIAAATASNAASEVVKKVSVVAASSAGEPAHQLSDGSGLLTSVLSNRTAVEFSGAELNFDAVATELRDAIYPAAVIGGSVDSPGTYWSSFWTAGPKTIGQHPLFLATTDPPSCCDCVTSDDCVQPNSLTCLEQVCRQGSCTEEVEQDGTLCGSQSECNAPACVGGVCQNNPLNEGASCDDGDNCTVGETCNQSGLCAGVVTPCDDGNVCTDDACDAAGVCGFEPNTASCDDGVPCTSDDLCADGVCGPGGFDHALCAGGLTSEQAACSVATCESAGCDFAALPSGPCAAGAVVGTCNLGGALPPGATGALASCGTADPYSQACATAAECQLAIDAAAGAQPDVTGSCLVADCVDGLCAISHATAGTACDVGNPCSTYTCDGLGQCLWAAPVTPVAAECSCDPAQPIADQCGALKGALAATGGCAQYHCFGAAPDGFCHAVSAGSGAACDPGSDVCWVGVCGQDLTCRPQPGVQSDLSAKPSVCDDATPCTTDSCVGPDQIGADSSGCVHTCAPEGAPCPGDATLVCGFDLAAGTCGCVDPGDSCLCPDPPTPCQIQACDTGSCAVTDLEDGASCLPDPAAPCVVGACDGGACVNPAARSCDDANDCTADSCDPTTGACLHTPSVCPLDPGMDPQCQVAACDPLSGGCVDGAPTEGALCVAGCSNPGTCSAVGQCESYVTEALWCGGTCAPCEVGACTTATDACGCAAAPDGTSCPGGTCGAGACVPDECAVDGDCDDSNPCTTNACVSKACEFAPLDATDCDDGDVCTENDTCSAGTCGGTPVAGCCLLDGECDDSDGCTADTCVANACSHADNGTCQCQAPVDCDDSDPCTVDDCVGNACSNTPDPGASCDDGDPCTSNDLCDGAGGCMGTVIASCCSSAAECDDSNDCTTDDCVGNACTNLDATDGANCDDGDVCTDSDQCTGGSCGGTVNASCCTTPDDCDDADACTVEGCQANACAQLPKSYTVPAGGAVLPDSANATPATPTPDYLDYLSMAVLNDGANVEVMFTMAAVIPATPPDTYAAGASTFADIALVLFSSAVSGDPGSSYSALTGATHILSARHEGTSWAGELRLWNASSGAWELDAGATVTVAANSDVMTVSASLSDIATCTPFKGLTQLRRDPAGVDELVWKLYTASGTDPAGAAIDPAL